MSMQLNSEGYLVISVLSSQKSQKTAKAIYRRIRKVTDTEHLSRQSFYSCLVDQAERKKMGVEIWRDGNSRTPIISKSTGMSEQHYIPEVLESVAFNEKLYQVMSELYQTEKLVHRAGIEKICFKAPGASDMMKHIDRCLFEETVNYPVRYQCLVTLNISASTQPRDSGTICILVNFHHYTDFAAKIFDPHTGIHPFPKEAPSRFFKLPTGFDKYYLPKLRKRIQEYTLNLDSKYSKFYRQLRRDGVIVPEEILPLEWKVISGKVGEAIIWDQRLPHYSTRNRSKRARICAYYSVFPVDDEYYKSEERKWLTRQIKRLEFYYSVNYGSFDYKVKNPEEVKLLENSDDKDRIEVILIQNSEIVGLIPYDR